MPGAWLHSMSLAISWGVACCQQHSAYCMLRSIDSVCVNVNLRALFQLPAGTDVTQRALSLTPALTASRVRGATPRVTARWRWGARGARAGASTFDISRGAQARSR